MSKGTQTDKPFQNRHGAGRVLAALLAKYSGHSDLVVLGLPRGGIPVAFEIARELNAPLDALVVRKLGVPGHDELAMGAIATGGTAGGVRILNKDVVQELDIPEWIIESVAKKEQQVLEQREKLYRNKRPTLPLRGRTVILVDDGLATGATMHAAVKVVKQQEPARLIVAVPTAARETCETFSGEVDECVCAVLPEYFYAVGAWYDDFTPVTDEEVSSLLELAANAAEPDRDEISD